MEKEKGRRDKKKKKKKIRWKPKSLKEVKGSIRQKEKK